MESNELGRHEACPYGRPDWAGTAPALLASRAPTLSYVKEGIIPLTA